MDGELLYYKERRDTRALGAIALSDGCVHEAPLSELRRRSAYAAYSAHLEAAAMFQNPRFDITR